ncbi:DUF6152 family protein [Phenylobacterium sp.]|jgi:hypothetical protein|uniref:DUF6152 family protein n=1 Tax=Phenylobacterium sp. TaxID=1871053 RepID=UPI0035B155E8
MMRRYLVPFAAVAALSAPAVALAHHGWGAYDAAQLVKVTAPLSDVSWSNPHGGAKVRYQGKVWDVVLAPIARMEARGLSKAMLSTGKPVTLEGYPRKDGTAEMRIERVRLNGAVVELRR